MRTYVTGVTLLLLLSALLSAIGGANVSVRAPQATVVVATVSAAVTKVDVAAAVAARPAVQGWRPALASGGAHWRLAAVVPLFLSRRRE